MLSSVVTALALAASITNVAAGPLRHGAPRHGARGYRQDAEILEDYTPATFFEQGGKAGACGDFHSDSDAVVALDYRRYGALDKKSSDCGRTVVITNTKNGKQVTAIVADACPTCQNDNCLDLSHGAFDQIATREEGMVPIKWHFA
ncbi:hypothetical protein FRC11_006089 [Ceratobasidium sp. 423]|nr:hypothetical protein FRC11_006089 [Ceratobasidium sp. 423]